MLPFFAALIIFTLALIGMSIGVIISNRCIKGSCGGLNNANGETEEGCSMCGSCDKGKLAKVEATNSVNQAES